MAVPLLSGVLAMLSRKYLGEVGLTRAFTVWALIGIIMALFVVEGWFIGYAGCYGQPESGFLTYFPNYILAVTAVLGIWSNSAYTHPQKILLMIFLAFYFLPFHLIYVIKDGEIIFALCTLIILGLLAIFLASLKRRKLFQLLIFLIGVRFLILYFQAFGGLAVTGFGLILSGGLIIGMVVYWNKYRLQMATWSEGLLK